MARKRRTQFSRSMTHRVHLLLLYVLGVVKQLEQSSGPARSSAYLVILSTLAPSAMEGNESKQQIAAENDLHYGRDGRVGVLP